ncbi:MAG: hypothetical protein ACREJO_00060 [Phycisphaerales bacterium]
MPAEFSIVVYQQSGGWEASCPVLKLTARNKDRMVAVADLRQSCISALQRMIEEATVFAPDLGDTEHTDEIDFDPEHPNDEGYNPGSNDWFEDQLHKVVARQRKRRQAKKDKEHLGGTT